MIEKRFPRLLLHLFRSVLGAMHLALPEARNGAEDVRFLKRRTELYPSEIVGS